MITKVSKKQNSLQHTHQAVLSGLVQVEEKLEAQAATIKDAVDNFVPRAGEEASLGQTFAEEEVMSSPDALCAQCGYCVLLLHRPCSVLFSTVFSHSVFCFLSCTGIGLTLALYIIVL
ncbi:unnamed protein product [Discosporangium mesarthrocarpum]